MKKKLLAGLLLATLAIGTLSPISSEAATKKATTETKTKTQTKIDGVAIKDLIAGKYNDIRLVKIKTEEEAIVYEGDKKEKKRIYCTEYTVREEKYHYKIDELYNDAVYPISRRYYGKDYEDTYYYSRNPYPHLRYNCNNFITAEESGTARDMVITLGSRQEEISKWNLDPSYFKTTKTKLTDDEIIIKGTYTFSVKKIRGKVNLFSKKKRLEGYNFDRDFFIDIGEDRLKICKSVKCNATAIFYRDTKQLKSLELKAKLPKKGYEFGEYGFGDRTIYNASYTFKHQLTEEQLAKRTPEITEDMIEGKENEFETIDCEYGSNYNFGFTAPGERFYTYNETVNDGNIPGFYIRTPYHSGEKPFSTGFDLSRFNITSSETEEDVITITGVYKIDTDSNTIYDNYVELFLNDYDELYGDYNDMTTDVTIEFNSKTKAMEKVTLKWNLDNINLTDSWYDVVDSEGICCYAVFTFK